jgi:hypothetical protein
MAALAEDGHPEDRRGRSLFGISATTTFRASISSGLQRARARGPESLRATVSRRTQHDARPCGRGIVHGGAR